MSAVLGWDIGGAHLKAALLDVDGSIIQVIQDPCPLWQGLHELEHSVQRIVAQLPVQSYRHAVTMTGEMADFFPSRDYGVRALASFMQQRFSTERVEFFAGQIGFVSLAEVTAHSEQIASANWIATAQWLAHTLPSGVLVDIGSTTADLIAFADGELLQRGHDDATRMQHSELVYTGVVRTSLMALAQKVPVDGHWLGVMAEHFANTADVYRILDRLPEGADQHETADGGAKNLIASQRRLARMVGMELDAQSPAAWRHLARYFSEQQLQLLSQALMTVCSRNALADTSTLVAAGCGRFLVDELASRLALPVCAFDDLIPAAKIVTGVDAADCAPAFAVAALWQTNHHKG